MARAKTVAESERHDGRFLYWWDIGLARRTLLEQAESMVFIQKDTRLRCEVEAKRLLPLLTPERRTTRKGNPWGVKVPCNSLNKLAIESGKGGSGGWAYLPAEWLAEKKEKDMSRDFEAYLRLDKRGLENKYVVIVKGEEVARGEDIKDMLERVKREYPREIPFVAKVPDERILVL